MHTTPMLILSLTTAVLLWFEISEATHSIE